MGREISFRIHIYIRFLYIYRIYILYISYISYIYKGKKVSVKKDKEKAKCMQIECQAFYSLTSFFSVYFSSFLSFSKAFFVSETISSNSTLFDYYRGKRERSHFDFDFDINQLG